MAEYKPEDVEKTVQLMVRSVGDFLRLDAAVARLETDEDYCRKVTDFLFYICLGRVYDTVLTPSAFREKVVTEAVARLEKVFRERMNR